MTRSSAKPLSDSSANAADTGPTSKKKQMVSARDEQTALAQPRVLVRQPQSAITSLRDIFRKYGLPEKLFFASLSFFMS